MFEGMAALCADLRTTSQEPTAPAAKIEGLVRCILGHFWDRRLFFALIHSNEHTPDDSGGREWERRRNEIVVIIQQAFEAAIAARHVRGIDPHMAAQMLLGMVRGVNRYRKPQDTLDDLVAAVVTVFWQGVALEPSRLGVGERGEGKCGF